MTYLGQFLDKDKLPRRFAEFVLLAIVSLGIVLRFRAFAFGRSLWLDESSLAVFFIDRSWGELLTLPLPNNQSSTPGFLVATKLLVDLFGFDVFQFRIAPFIASLASLILFYFLVKKLYTNIWTTSLALSLFAFSPVLIYYSSEFKQYQFDVLSVIIVLVFLVLGKKVPSASSGVVYLAIAVSSLPGILAILTFEAGKVLTTEKDQYFSSPKHLFRRLFPLLVGTGAHFVYIFANARSSNLERTMKAFWLDRGGLAPDSIESLSDLLWLPRSIANQLAEITIPQIFSTTSTTFHSLWQWLIPLLILVAGIQLKKNKVTDNQKMFVLFTSLLFIASLALASAQLYPIGGRVSIYLIPPLIVLVALALEALIKSSGQFRAPISLVLAFSLLLQPIAYDLRLFLEPYNNRDWKSALTMIENISGTDIGILSKGRNINMLLIHQEMGYGTSIEIQAIKNDWKSKYENGTFSDNSYWFVTTRLSGTEKAIRDFLLERGYSELCYYSANETVVSLVSKEELGRPRCVLDKK